MNAKEDAMQIADVMTRQVDLADPDMRIGEAASMMREDDVGALPVGENDRLAGMVTDRDIVVRGIAGGLSLDEMTVRDVMSEGVFYCFEDETLDRAGEAMAEHQVHRLPVLNRDKRLTGMIALADIARSGSDGERAVITALKGISEPTGKSRR